MHIEIMGLSEAEVESVSESLTALGLQYDADFTTVYGTEWSLVGVRLLSAPAMQAGAGLCKEAA